MIRTICIKAPTCRFSNLNVVPNSNFSGLTFFVSCICRISYTRTVVKLFHNPAGKKFVCKNIGKCGAHGEHPLASKIHSPNTESFVSGIALGEMTIYLFTGHLCWATLIFTSDPNFWTSICMVLCTVVSASPYIHSHCWCILPPTGWLGH